MLRVLLASASFTAAFFCQVTRGPTYLLRLCNNVIPILVVGALNYSVMLHLNILFFSTVNLNIIFLETKFNCNVFGTGLSLIEDAKSYGLEISISIVMGLIRIYLMNHLNPFLDLMGP